MTLIISTKVSPECIITVTDGQSTRGQISTASSKKIYTLGNDHIIAGSGPSSFLHYVINESIEKMENFGETDYTTNDIAEAVYNSMDKHITSYKTKELKSHYEDAINLENLFMDPSKTGLDPVEIEKARNVLKGLDRELQSDFLIAGVRDTSEIYAAPYHFEPHIVTTHYYSIGSAKTIADSIMSYHLRNMSPAKREKMEPGRACEIMLKALQYSGSDIFVGGNTQISVMEKGKDIRSLSSGDAQIMQDVLRLDARERISRKQARRYIKEIVEQGADWKFVLEQLEKRLNVDEVSEIRKSLSE